MRARKCGEQDHLVGDDLAALLADLERAGDAHRLVGGEVDLGLAVGLGPGDHLDRAGLVLEREGGVAVALAAVLELQALDDAADGDRALVAACRAAARRAAVVKRLRSASYLSSGWAVM